MLYGGKDKNGTEKKGTLIVENGIIIRKLSIFDKFWKGLGGGITILPSDHSSAERAEEY